MNNLQNTRTQSRLISIAANAGVGTTPEPIELDTEYERVTGIVVHQIGTHNKYRVGLRNKEGEYYHDLALYSHYQQLGDQRYMETDFPVIDQKIFIAVNVLEQINSALEFEIVFELTR